MSTVLLRTFFATMSTGHPTKLSTTNFSPFDAEIALRDVPRSIPTWSISGWDAISSCSFLLRRVVRRRVCVNPVEESLGDLLAVGIGTQQRRLVSVRQASHLGENRRHVRGYENDEWRSFHAPVLEPRIGFLETRIEVLLNACGQLLRFLAPSVGIHPVEQPAQVRQRISGGTVLRCRKLRERRVVGWTEIVGLDSTGRGVLENRVDVDRYENVAA